jgi:hypothetical protein
MTQPAASAPDSRPNPQKRNLIIRRVARAPWWLLIAAALIVAFLLSVSGDRNYQEVTGRIRS